MSADDFSRAAKLLSAITGNPESMRFLKILGNPASKARPRFGKGGVVYTSNESKEAERKTAMHLRLAFKKPMTGNVALVCIFFRPNKQRIDADNMLKHVCDAANKILWIDDSQATSITGIVELDSECPRTIIGIAEHATSMRRGTSDTEICINCEKPYVIAGKANPGKFCSAKCRYQSAAIAPIGEKACAHCGKSFSPSNTRQRICGAACRVASMVGRNRSAAQPRSSCSDCGKHLSHTRGGRCRECWRKA